VVANVPVTIMTIVVIGAIVVIVVANAEASPKMTGLQDSSLQRDAWMAWTRDSLLITSSNRLVPRIGICRIFRYGITSLLSLLLLKLQKRLYRYSLTVVLKADPS